MLAERLAHWLNRVLAAGREVSCDAFGEEDECAHHPGERARPQKSVLVEHAAAVGEIPQDAFVSAEQAESALGRTVTTELDVDLSEAVDRDTKEEEEALAGRQVNPSGVDYSCIAWQPCAPGLVRAAVVGWESDCAGRQLGHASFACSAADVAAKLQGGLAHLAQAFRAELACPREDFNTMTQSLDPTQKLFAQMVAQWAEKPLEWRQALPAGRVVPSSARATRTAKVAP